MLAACPGKASLPEEGTQSPHFTDSSSSSRACIDRTLSWRLNYRKLREVDLKSLQRLDGARRTAEWGKTTGYEEDGEPQEHHLPSRQPDDDEKEADLSINTHYTPLTRKTSTKGRGRLSVEETTPILERR